jgi:hypothetical protein
VARQNIMVGAVVEQSHSPHEKKGSPSVPFKGTPAMTQLLKVQLLPNSTISWGPSLQHRSLWGTFKIQAMVSLA